MLDLKTVVVKGIHCVLRKTGAYGICFKQKKPSLNKNGYHLEQLKRIRDSGLWQGFESAGDLLRLENSAPTFVDMEDPQALLPWWKVQFGPEDPKDFWEVARGWQWLRAYLGADSASSRDRVLKQVWEFLEQNPYPNGLSWAVGLDVAVRAFNLLFLYALSKEEFLRESLWQHRCYLKKMLWLSKNAVRNNHYLGELAALAVLEDFFGQKEAGRLKKELQNEIPRQFYADGVNEEQSIRYHKFSLEFLLLAYAFLDIRVPEGFWERSGEFLLGVMRSDGSWPSIGDDDLGCVIRLHDDPLSGDYRAVLSCLAVLTGRGDFKKAAGELYPEAKLFFSEAQDKWDQIKDRERDAVSVFPEGGFANLHNDKEGQGILVKFGPHKWHAHADLFHLELWCRNQSILVDSGTYRYNNVPEDRKYFRSTVAHNTLVFQGRDQTRQLTTFRWGFPAKVLDWNFQETKGSFSFTASHDGYKRKGIIHQPEVVLTREREQGPFKELAVVDKAEGRGTGTVEVFWHFHPDLDVASVEENIFEVTRSGESIARITVQAEITVEAEIITAPYSESYGHLGSHKVLRLRLEKTSKKTMTIKTTFLFLEKTGATK